MTAQPAILETVSALRAYVAVRRKAGRSLALVPTMGALHDGHIELVRRGLQEADEAIVSIFVNPTQFGPHEDFNTYPQRWNDDLARLASAGAHALYHPAVAEMYPPGAATAVSVASLRDVLEGAVRPGHFDGVATIVAKLLLQTMPDVALFGEKDYQQLQVIRRMTADLDIPVRIMGVPTVRDANGLALSSRNVYLSPENYNVAIRLNGILAGIGEAVRQGAAWVDALAAGRVALGKAGFDAIDYLDIRDAATLQSPEPGQRENLRVLAAVRFGRTRLIDNMALIEE